MTLVDSNIIRIVDQPKDVLHSLVFYAAVLFAIISAMNCFINGTTRLSKIIVSRGRITTMQPSILLFCFTLVSCLAGHTDAAYNSPNPPMTQPPTNANCLAAYTLSSMELDGLTNPMIDGKINFMGDGWCDSILGWNGSE